MTRKSIKFSHLLPGVYFLGCLGTWIDFQNSNPDGLANFGLLVMTLPSSLIERFVTYQFYGNYNAGSFWEPLLIRFGLPQGYIASHIYWFLPLVILQMLILCILGRVIDSRRRGHD